MEEFEHYLQELKDKVSLDKSIPKDFSDAVNVIWAKFHNCKKYPNTKWKNFSKN